MKSNYQHDFIQLAIEHKALTFGDFTLKSGRKSPYFFNCGLFYQASALQKLGEFYAKVISNASLSFDVLFGPAYKGIPLVTATSIALNHQGHNYPIAFNRKEAKDHGEGGMLVGAPLKNQRVLLLDDVITAGTAFHESKKLIESQGGEIVGMVIALDRQEIGSEGKQSAVQEIQSKESIPVVSIATLGDLIAYLQENTSELLSNTLQDMKDYQQQYGS